MSSDTAAEFRCGVFFGLSEILFARLALDVNGRAIKLFLVI